MQLALPQLQAHLQKGLRSLYTLYGDEPLLVQEAADAVRQAARTQGYTERSMHTVAGAHFDWSAVLAAGGSMSLFAERQILEIRIPSGKPGKDGGAMLTQLAQMAQGNDSTLTLLLLPRLDAATKKSAWFGALENSGVMIQIDPIERQALPQWIAQRLQPIAKRRAWSSGAAVLAVFCGPCGGQLAGRAPRN
jgi:DNA polymerase-3 subunit delta